MKHKIAELGGALLDAAVAKAEGLQPFVIGSYMESGVTYWRGAPPPYSSEWKDGGPILERERMEVSPKSAGAGWRADHIGIRNVCRAFGPTPLIAAMRAYCMSKFGEEVELP